MQKLLTIIVPVYKVEPYINKCLDSCLIYKTNEDEQKVLDDELMNQLEVIIVNDGTPDNSAEMSREYVKRYPQTFRQIDKENGGHGSAWNVGLKEATGKYLRFLDSDDWLTSLGEFMNKLAQSDADIVLTNYRRFHVPINKYVEYKCIVAVDKTVKITRPLLQTLPHGYIDLNFWTATYKTSILQSLWPLMAERVMYDDSILSFAPLIKGRTITGVDMVLYNYLLGREGQSMTVNIQRKKAASYLVCLKREEELLSSIVPSEIPADILECIHEVIAEYAHFVFSSFVYLPYKEAKKYMRHVDKHYHPKKPSKVYLRYKHFPFAAFYLLERGRYSLAQLKSNKK